MQINTVGYTDDLVKTKVLRFFGVVFDSCMVKLLSYQLIYTRAIEAEDCTFGAWIQIGNPAIKN